MRVRLGFFFSRAVGRNEPAPSFPQLTPPRGPTATEFASLSRQLGYLPRTFVPVDGSIRNGRSVWEFPSLAHAPDPTSHPLPLSPRWLRHTRFAHDPTHPPCRSAHGSIPTAGPMATRECFRVVHRRHK